MNSRAVFAAVVALALVAGVLAGAWYTLREQAPAFCELSDRPIHSNMHTLVKVDGKKYHACCARCGLTVAAQTGQRVQILEVTDYVSGRPLDAAEAYYVEGSHVEVCSAPRLRVDEARTPYVRLFDRCAPSTLAFAREADARAFIAEHGGGVKHLDELMSELHGPAEPAEEHRHD